MPETITIRSGCHYNPMELAAAYKAWLTATGKTQQDPAELLKKDQGTISRPEHGVIISADCEDELPKIAKLLDDGVAIGDADLRPSKSFAGRMVFTAVARTAAKSATVESTVEHCMEALRLLPEAEAKKVLAELRKRVSPPKATAPAADDQTGETH